MTFTEMVDDVCERLNLTTPDAITRVGKRINRRYRRVRSELGMDNSRRVQLSYSVVTGTRLQTITTVSKVAAVINESLSPNSPPLTQITYDEMLTVVPHTGAPTCWAIKLYGPDSVTLIFDTSFADATDLSIDARETTVDLTGTDEPQFPEDFHEVLVWGALSDELFKKEKSPLKKEADQQWEYFLGRMRLDSATQAWGDYQQGKYKLDEDNRYRRFVSGGTSDGDDNAVSVPFYFNVMDPAYGAANDGVHDDTAAVRAAITDAAANGGGTVFFPYGAGCLITEDITVPVGEANVVSFLGENWANGGIIFSGAAVTRGLHFLGSSLDYCGTVENLAIACTNSAARGITFEDVNHPGVRRCYISGAAGAGVFFDTTLMGVLEDVLFTGCGSATEATVEVDNSTTWEWRHSRISGGTTTQGGLRIDRTIGGAVRGGNIESCGVPIRLCSKTEDTTPVEAFGFYDLDLEAPGQHYIEGGYGWTGSAFLGCENLVFSNILGFASGSTDIRYGIKLKNSIGVSIDKTLLVLAGGSQVASFFLDTNVGGVDVRANRAGFGGSTPWVVDGGSQSGWATPHLDFSQVHMASYEQSALATSGATPSIMLAAQGGVYKQVSITQGGATTLTKFLVTGNLLRNTRLFVTFGDSNTTLQHDTGATSYTLKLLAGKDVAAQSGRVYEFIYDGVHWCEVEGIPLLARPIGSTTVVGTDADLNEKTLATFTIPANTFDANHVTGGKFWANLTTVAAGGDLKVKIDGVTIATGLSTSTPVAGTLDVIMGFMRQSSTLLVGYVLIVNGAAAGSAIVSSQGFSATIAAGSSVALTITGQNVAVAAANRISFSRGQVTFDGTPTAAFIG